MTSASSSDSILELRGKTAFFRGQEVRHLSHTVLEHLILSIGPFGPLGAFLGFDQRTYITYLCQSVEDLERIKTNAQGGDFPIYPARRAIGGHGTLEMFWRRRRATRGILGAVQAHPVVGAGLMVTHMSVRPSWRRNRLNSHIINLVMDSHFCHSVEYSEPTQLGKLFIRKGYNAESEDRLAPF